MLQFVWASVSIKERVELSDPKERLEEGPLLEALNEEKNSGVGDGHKQKKNETSCKERDVFSFEVVHVTVIEPDPLNIAIRIDELC